jgi:hypothetical protein
MVHHPVAGEDLVSLRLVVVELIKRLDCGMSTCQRSKLLLVGYTTTSLTSEGRLKCMICGKFKSAIAKDNQTPAGYSNKQLADARLHKSRGQPYQVKCISCSGVPKMEMKCTYCQVDKELNEFAKTHRRDRDNAVSPDLMI